MRKYFKAYQYALTLVLVAILTPMIIAAFYNRLYADDITQPYAAMMAIRNGGTFLDAFAAACEGAWNRYLTWNGVFFSMLLSYFPPMVFHYRLAFIHPILIMLLMVGANFSLCGAVARLGPQPPPKSLVRSTALLMSIMMLLLMESVAEGIYWYSGAINYTFMFVLSVYLFAGWLRLLRGATRRSASYVVRFSLLCLGFFMLGGANFSTSTVSVALGGLIVLWLLVQKKSAVVMLPYAFLLAGYAVAVFAPGNAVRQATFGERASLPIALITSFQAAFNYIFSDVRCYALLLLFLPVAIALGRYMPFRYRYGWLVPLLSLALLAASFFPAFYALKHDGPPRQQNVHFLLFCILLFANAIYGAGYVRHLLMKRFERKADGKAIVGDRTLYAYTLCAAVVFALLCVPNLTFEPLMFKCKLPAVKAVSELRDGSLRTFAEKYDELVGRIQNNPDNLIETSYIPTLYLFPTEWFSDDVNYVKNRKFAKYYGNENTRVAWRADAE